MFDTDDGWQVKVHPQFLGWGIYSPIYREWQLDAFNLPLHFISLQEAKDYLHWRAGA